MEETDKIAGNAETIWTKAYLTENHSLILFGSGMSNSNVHNHSPLPVLVAGGAAGQMKGGRHLLYQDETPMANLLLSILHKAGIDMDNVGDSTGPLTEL